MTSHECKLTGWQWAKQLSEQNATHMTKSGWWQSLKSKQDNTRQVAEMTKRWSPVINRRYFRRHGCPWKCFRRWGTHSSLPWEWWLPGTRWSPFGTFTRWIWATSISWCFLSEHSRVSSELHCCLDEGVQVTGWCHDQGDVCQLASLRPSSFFLIFWFLASSKLAFHFRMFLSDSSWTVPHEWSWGWESARIDLLVATRDNCFGVPGLSPIGERQNLEVLSLDLWRPLWNPAGLPSAAGFQLLVHAKCLLLCFYPFLSAFCSISSDLA